MIFMVIGFLLMSVFLSICAFKGGYHFGYYRLLQRAAELNELIMKTNDIAVFEEWNNFLIASNAKKDRASYLEWLKWGFKDSGVEP